MLLIAAHKGYGLYGVQVHCKALTQQLPSVPPMLPHATACESGHNSVLRARRTCTFDAAPQSISRGRRMASACAAHADMHPDAATQREGASRGHGRPACTQAAHPQPISTRARPLRHCDSELAADVAVAERLPKSEARAVSARMKLLTPDLDSDTRTCCRRVTAASAAPEQRARVLSVGLRPPSPKHPYPVLAVALSTIARARGHA